MRTMNNKLFPILLIFLTLAAGSLSGCTSTTSRAEGLATVVPVVTQSAGVISEGRLVPRQFVTMSFTTGGTVAEILVKEGDVVREGQLLARLSQREQFAAAIANADIELLNARQALDELNENAEVITAAALKKVADTRDAVRSAERRKNNLETGNSKTDVDTAFANMVILKDRLEQANKDYASYENKPEDNVKRAGLLSKMADAQKKYDNAVRLLNNLQGDASEIDLAIADADLSLAQAQLALAEQEYEKVKNGPDPDALASAQARLNAAETGLAAAQAAYDETELRAPFDGTIAKIHLKLAEQTNPGIPALVLGDFSEWVLETDDLTELDVPKIEVGEEVRLTFDALLDLELTGKIESISNIDEQKFGDVTYTTRIRVLDGDPRLRWGMTVVAQIGD